jgi:hypothetical protein
MAFKRVLIAVDDSPIAAHAANVGFDLQTGILDGPQRGRRVVTELLNLDSFQKQDELQVLLKCLLAGPQELNRQLRSIREPRCSLRPATSLNGRIAKWLSDDPSRPVLQGLRKRWECQFGHLLHYPKPVQSSA